jgi:hypothetical protein
VTQDWHALEYAAPALKADREFVLAAVALHGNALAYATYALRADREIVLAAVVRNGRALRHAAPALKADREIVLVARQQTVQKSTGGKAAAPLVIVYDSDSE